MARNHFLPSINNEVDDAIDKTYAANLESLNKLILVLFSKDTTVVPKESSWFGSYAPTDSDLNYNQAPTTMERTVIPMRSQTVYVENRIGLKTLDERGGLVLTTCDGVHMQLSDDCWKPLAQKYIGGVIDKLSPTSVYTLKVQ